MANRHQLIAEGDAYEEFKIWSGLCDPEVTAEIEPRVVSKTEGEAQSKLTLPVGAAFRCDQRGEFHLARLVSQNVVTATSFIVDG